MYSVHKMRYLLVKTEGFSLFSPCNLADSALSFLIVMFTISENMTLKIISLIFFSHKESSIYLLLGIQMCASCLKLKMASLLITEKVYKITHFEILALQTFSHQYIKQTLHSDILSPDSGFWLRQAYELLFLLFLFFHQTTNSLLSIAML